MRRTLSGVEEPEERIDFDQAQHPSWRLFHAHPDVGLAEIDGDSMWEASTRPGLRWLKLPLGEQEARERDFLRALLEVAARDPEARFEAMPGGGEETAEALAARIGGSVLEGGAVGGSLTAHATGRIAAEPLPFCVQAATLFVDGLGRDRLGVWIDRWKADVLERELEGAWWEPAQERERARAREDVELRRRRDVDRELRARVLLTWERRSGLLIAVAIFTAHALDWEPLGWLGTPVVIATALIVALSQAGKAIERWYRRAAEAS